MATVDGRLFRCLTLLLAIVEQAILELDAGDWANEPLRASLTELSERLYSELRTASAASA